jgi:ATP-dependent exoDNAse (exonuclease V) beta subunit
VIIGKLQSKLEPLIQSILEVIQNELPQYNLYQLVLTHIYEMALLNEIEKVMQDFRDNENIVHISEFNKRIATIVQREPVPFIYERIGEKYRHFLIDEFQDTSVLQWHNMLPHLENSLASNYFNMIVGDGKQAIYRFRNGDVEQFAALPGLMHHDGDPIMLQREQLLRHHCLELELDTNYRSFREVVEFNNEFFEFAKKLIPENLQTIYDCSPQKVDEKKTGGTVDIHFLKFEKKQTETDAGTDTMEDKQQQWMAAIMEQVQRQLAKFQPGQIAILTRKNSQASDIAQHLTYKGISVVTSEALLLTSSPEVSFIIALLRFINDKTNKINIGEMLAFLFSRNPEKIAGFDQLLNLSIDINTKNPDGLPLSALLKKVFGYDTDFTKLASLSLTDLVHEAIRVFELSEGGRNDFVRFFIDIVIKYTATNPEGIPDFLRFWEEECQDKSIVVPETMQAVTVMTIHKAKGLQFPVVIFPYADIQSKNFGEFLWIDPKLMEDTPLPMALVKTGTLLKESSHSEINETEIGKSKLDALNVLYVAMTRPVERLVVMMDSKAREDGTWPVSDKLLDGADIFYQYINDKGLWDKEKLQYHFGADVSEDFKTEIKVPEHDEKTTESLHAGRWREKLSIRYRAPEFWEGAAPDRRRDRGIMMHHLLSQINTSADIRSAVEQAAMQGLLAAAEKEAIAKDLDQLVNHSTLAPFFAPGAAVMTERDILLPDGNVLRPDRVVKLASGAAVIDYKTGKENPIHHQQMETYAAALRAMGMTDVERYLVYLPSDEHADMKIEKV